MICQNPNCKKADTAHNHKTGKIILNGKTLCDGFVADVKPIVVTPESNNAVTLEATLPQIPPEVPIR